MQNIIYKINISLLLILVLSIPVLAQSAPPSTPIDGGLSLLLAAGGLYGLKKLKSKKG